MKARMIVLFILCIGLFSSLFFVSNVRGDNVFSQKNSIAREDSQSSSVITVAMSIINVDGLSQTNIFTLPSDELMDTSNMEGEDCSDVVLETPDILFPYHESQIETISPEFLWDVHGMNKEGMRLYLEIYEYDADNWSFFLWTYVGTENPNTNWIFHSNFRPNTKYELWAYYGCPLNGVYGPSEYIVFTTGDGENLPNGPSLVFPLDDAVLNDGSITFKWEPNGAMNYFVQLRPSSLFGSDYWIPLWWTTSNQYYMGLIQNDEYEWRVKARNEKGIGEPSEVWKFTFNDCTAASDSVQPILMVTGWGGSEKKTQLSQDDQLQYFVDYLDNFGYVEGCNLFYATGTSPYLYLSQNAEVIQTNLCDAYTSIKVFDSDWDGHFDVIAHSYGGLRVRAYLEDASLYGKGGSRCPSTQNWVWVDNLFTMGTPHGGEYGDLPFAALIGFCAVFPSISFCGGSDGTQWPALLEMLPPVRLVQNLSHRQPKDTCYYLLAGDARQQSGSFPYLLRSFYEWNPKTSFVPNDLAVYQGSVHALVRFPLNAHYPRTVNLFTDNLHGHVPVLYKDSDLRSFVKPDTTFVEKIWPYVGRTDCRATYVRQNLDEKVVSVVELIEARQQPQQMSTGPILDVSSGVISSTGVVSGEFELTGGGASQVNMLWLTGDIELVLTDPLGNSISSWNVESNSNIDYVNFNTGFGLMATYLITNTEVGTWRFTITANNSEKPVGYRLFIVPSVPIAVNVAVPEWLPNGRSVVITAAVVYSESVFIAEGNVTVEIHQPDGTFDTIVMFDDGNHSDNAPNDGVFGTIYTRTTKGGIYGIVINAIGAYVGEDYTRTATAFFVVAPSSASLARQYGDAGVDDNDDGLYEWLKVKVGLTVTEPSTYVLSIDLYAGERFIAYVRKRIWFTAETSFVDILFDGDIIKEQQFNGPYTVRNVLLLDEAKTTLLIEAMDNVYTTAEYNYLEFGTPKVYLPMILK